MLVGARDSILFAAFASSGIDCFDCIVQEIHACHNRCMSGRSCSPSHDGEAMSDL